MLKITYEEKRNVIALWEDFAVEYCPSSVRILLAGQRIMAYGIKAKDALHLACAIDESGCDYFITTDKGLTKKNVNNIIIVNPIDFVRKMDR